MFSDDGHRSPPPEVVLSPADAVITPVCSSAPEPAPVDQFLPPRRSHTDTTPAGFAEQLMVGTTN